MVEILNHPRHSSFFAQHSLGGLAHVTTPHAVIIANPQAGGGRARNIAVKAQSALASAGVNVTLHLPASREQLQVISRQACAEQPAVVLACGGDGTVHDILQAAIAFNTTLGIIPGGTGNDIARSLGLPRKTSDSFFHKMVKSIHNQHCELIDASKILRDGEQVWSLGVISIGFDSAVNERANRISHLRGTFRYIVALLAELREFQCHQYTVTIDGVQHRDSAVLIAVGNGGNYGGGMRICPQADMKDGLLDITWVDPAPRRTVLRVFPQIFSGRHINHPLVHTYRATEISIESPDSIIYADGERVGSPPVLIQLVPEAVRVLMNR
jgi:diacylglycerol kinase (ATP)